MERQRDDGVWERVPHGSKPCWSCSKYNPETGEYEEATGVQNIRVRIEEVGSDDVVLKEANGWATLERTESCPRCKGEKVYYPQFLKDRNYNVFSILGNVRNGYGFAGIPTSSGFAYISDSRGLPEDLSAECIEHLAMIGERFEDGRIVDDPEARDRFWGDDLDEEEYEKNGSAYERMERETKEGYWSFGDHSWSWVTLAEVLEDYDWEQTVVQVGTVSPWQFEQFRKQGHPDAWSGGVSGANVENISNDEMARMIDDGDIVFGVDSADDPKRVAADMFFGDGMPYTTREQREEAKRTGSVQTAVERKSYYTVVTWPTPYTDCVGKGFFEELDQIKQFAPDGDLKRIRLVFGFDS